MSGTTGTLVMNRLVDQKVYLDANIFIYAIEGFENYKPILLRLLEMIDSGKINAITSELTLSECLVKPYKYNKIDIANVYERFIQSSSTLNVKGIFRDILIDAAKIRAKGVALKLPDAIHLATAISEQCKIFLTNDKGIKSTDIQVVFLDSIQL